MSESKQCPSKTSRFPRRLLLGPAAGRAHVNRLHKRVGVAIVVLIVSIASPARAQTDTQVWANVTLDWINSHALKLALDIEPKVLVSKGASDPGWATIDVTPSVEYIRWNWVDVTGELHFARTRQSDHQDSTEVSPRVGLRFHLLSNIRDDLLKEKQPKRRLVLRNLARVEWRNLSYSDGTPDASTVRVRDRIEMEFPINRPRVSDNLAWYAVTDAEWFWTWADPSERFANKQRVRSGIARRWTYAWRTEFLAVWDRSRDSAQSGFITADFALDVRVRRVW